MKSSGRLFYAALAILLVTLTRFPWWSAVILFYVIDGMAQNRALLLLNSLTLQEMRERRLLIDDEPPPHLHAVDYIDDRYDPGDGEAS